MIIVAYGVNASGKDSVFKKLSNEHGNIAYIPTSQMLMKAAGIIDDIDFKNAPSREKYDKLESITSERRDLLMGGVFFQAIKEVEEQVGIVVVPMHLSIIKKTDNRTYFDAPKFNPWLGGVDLFVYIKSPAQEILQRMRSDIESSARHRHLPTETELRMQIMQTEQRLKELRVLYPYKEFVEVKNNNGMLDRAVDTTLASIIRLQPEEYSYETTSTERRERDLFKIR